MAPNRLKRRRAGPATDCIWVGDITYLVSKKKGVSVSRGSARLGAAET